MSDKVDIDYDFIKKWLKRGQLKALAKKYGIHRNTATRIMKGHFQNQDFTKLVYETAIQQAQTFISIHEKVNELKEKSL